MRFISITYIGGLVVLLLMVWRHVVTGEPIYHFTRDPAALAGMSPSSGILSNMGVVLWLATGAVCFLTSSVLASSRERRFLLGAGLLSTCLGLDDLLQLHEAYYPRIGFPDEAVYAGYMLAVGTWLVVYRRLIRSTVFVPFAIALAAFALGLVADKFHDAAAPWHHLYEDGAKWIGIVGWSAYLTHTCYAYLSRGMRARQAQHDPSLMSAEK